MPSPFDARRVWIVGPPGSGKTTFAQRLAAVIGVAPTHMDELFWKPGWTWSTDEELRHRVAAVVLRSRWVIDGNYARIRRDYVHRAELHVWLDFPLHATLTRLLVRSVSRAVTRQPICNGNYESLWRTFTSRESILYYGWQTHGQFRRRYTTELADLPHVRLRNPREVDAWLTAVETRKPGVYGGNGWRANSR
jgi:adenylate kinase family enzyme